MSLHNIHLLLVILAVVAATASALFIRDGSLSLRPVPMPSLASCYRRCKRAEASLPQVRPGPFMKPEPFPFNQIPIKRSGLASCYMWCNTVRGRIMPIA